MIVILEWWCKKVGKQFNFVKKENFIFEFAFELRLNLETTIFHVYWSAN